MPRGVAATETDGRGIHLIAHLAHVPEKWTPVFRKGEEDMRKRKNLERIPIQLKPEAL
jgi:hypothetical protein